MQRRPENDFGCRRKEKNMSDKRVWIYCRVAHPESDNHILKIQQEYLIRYAATNGYTIAGITAEYGSGLDFGRTGLSEVMEAAKYGKMDAVLVSKLDRIGRTIKKLIEFENELNERHVELLCSDGSNNTAFIQNIFSEALKPVFTR